jgi:hypothetical protein
MCCVTSRKKRVREKVSVLPRKNPVSAVQEIRVASRDIVKFCG